jgi:hypothetical protein
MPYGPPMETPQTPSQPGQPEQPERAIEQAMAAASRGELAVAAEHFEVAARGFVTAGKLGEAKAALSNLAFMRKGCGDFAGALAAIDEGVALFTAETSDRERAPLLLTRAGVLDRLADPAAVEAWNATAEAMRAQPLMNVVCLAHAAGALMPIDRAEARRRALEAIRLLGGEAPLPFLVGLIGAVGDSAPGATGIPFLAQASWLMFSHPETCTPSNAPFLEMLAERLGYEQPAAEALGLIGLMLASTKKDTPDHRPVMSHVARILHGGAAARSISVDAMAELCQRGGAREPGELAAVLEALIGEDWLIRGNVQLS